MKSQRLKRGVAATTAVYAALVMGAVLTPVVATAANGDGPVDISNRETVNAKLTPSGEVDLARVYDQVTVTGSGQVEFTNPISTEGLRNLDGFGSPELSGDEIVSSVDADGQSTQRYVADFTKELPVEVRVTYRLDGEELDAEDVVGKSGELEVTYRVENVTGEPTEVSYEDGTGARATSTEMVYTPLAATMDIILPNSMTAVEAPAGAVAGDGRGGTKLKYSITLIPPLSNPVSEVSYKADVEDAVIPPANLTIAVIRPLENPTVSSAKKSFEDGAQTGQDLTDGAQQIDDNLLRLQDGAGQLLAGLLQLEDGANQLEDGLSGTAVSGANQLNDGAQELSAGLNGTAVPGSEQLADGAAQVDAGAQQLAAGGDELAAGIASLNSGLNALSKGVAALPTTVKQQVEADPDYQLLLGTLTKIIAGIGTPSDTTTATLEGGLNNVIWGLRNPAGYPANDCAVALGGGTPTQCGAMDAVQFIAGLLSTGAADLDQLKPIFSALNGALVAPCPAVPPPPPAFPPATPCDLLGTLYYALFATPAQDPPLGGLQSQAGAAAVALADVYSAVDAQLIPGVQAIKRALYNSPCDPAQTNPGASDFCGISQALGLVKAGIPTLVDGITQSIAAQLGAGIGSSPPPSGCNPTQTLTCAGAALVAGSNQLADGTAQLAANTPALAAGADDLSVGLIAAGDGAAQIADGTEQLADGLTDAADGSTQIADGLGQAVPGAEQIEDGAGRLSAEGSQQLLAAGNATALDFGTRVAVIEASAERTADGGLPYGAPEDSAQASAAYSYDIAGAGGASDSNVARLIAALVLLGGAAAGAYLLAQRS